MQINLNYTHSETIGYGRLGVKLAAALEAKGVEVFTHMPPPEGVEFDVLGAQGRKAGTASSACWVSVPSHATGWWDTQSVSIFTMWEAMRLPESFRENLHNFDTVLVPSEQNVELFSRYHDNVRLVLLGVDPTEWHFVERTPPGRFFDFLIGGSGARKGTDIAHRAFRLAFPEGSWGSGPTPRLVMKNPRGEPFHGDRVEIISGKIDAAEEQALYASAHCYLQPSRGEGFGLQPLQALAQGLPTILTDAHGHASFAHLGYGVSATPKQSDYFIYGEAGDWWEPSLDEFVDLMRWVYDNYGQAAEKARVASNVVAQDFTWERTAEQFLDAVPDNGPFVPGTWIQPEPMLFRLRVQRQVKADIAGRRVIMEPGVDYWEMADVKRILWESGALDPECAADDTCVPQSQAEARGLTTQETDYCIGCGQRYGTGLTRADDLHLAREGSGEGVGDADLTKWHAGG